MWTKLKLIRRNIMPKMQYTEKKGLVQTSGQGVSLDGALSLRTPEVLFRWNYIDCSQPAISAASSAGASVTADGHKSPMIWSGTNGEIYLTDLTRIGAVTAAVETPLIEGTVPATDTAATVAGLNMQMDQDTANDVGWELNFGSPMGCGRAFTVGEHAGYIDLSVFCEQWTSYDAVSIGFRKVEPVNTGHAPIVAAGAGDPLYTDFATFGIQEADLIQIATDLNDAGGTYTDTTDTPSDSENQRFRVSLAKTGAVTYTMEQNGVANGGTMEAPTAVAAFSFDSGDKVIPYITVHGSDNADTALLIKHIEIKRTPGSLYTPGA
jgi:hypothetical protein